VVRVRRTGISGSDGPVVSQVTIRAAATRVAAATRWSRTYRCVVENAGVAEQPAQLEYGQPLVGQGGRGRVAEHVRGDPGGQDPA
jgi:hypothetical protein